VQRFSILAGLAALALAPLEREQQTSFAVVDCAGEPVDVEFGVGHGFTGVSDPLILKLIVTKTF
jgi:hypothetical protein